MIRMNRKQEQHKIDILLGQRIRHFRKKYRLSLVEFGEMTGISHQQVYKYEKAENKMSATQLYRFAQLFRIRPNTFFAELPKS